MKRLLLPIFLFGCAQNALAQNLVINGDFESYDNLGRSTGWFQPDGEYNHFYHADLREKTGNAASGKGYHCLCMYSREENEFMHVALDKKLEKGRVYKLEMMVRLSNTTDEVFKDNHLTNVKTLDWYFTAVPIQVKYKLFITAEPSVSFKFKAPQPRDWTLMETEYAATGEEQYLTIGNLTRIYEKIKADEMIGSLQEQYYRYEKTETHLCDSVKEVYMAGIDRKLISEGQDQDFSMNPYIKTKTKKKKLSRSRRKAYEAEIQKNNYASAMIRKEQETIRNKYERLRRDITWEVELQKNQYAINVCFDNIAITEIPGKKVESPDPLLSLEPTTGNTLVLKNVQFNTDSYEILPASYPELDKLVGWLRKNEQARIQVSGHTDNTGKEKHNLGLSENRAKAVKQYLEQQGIPAGRMRSRGYAAQFPLADNISEQGKALNRRVEFTVL